MIKFHVRNGDMVRVISGGAKGKEGLVVKVLTTKNQVVVAGARVMKKATKARQGVEGGIIELDGPVHISNVKVLVPVARKQGEKVAKKAKK